MATTITREGSRMRGAVRLLVISASLGCAATPENGVATSLAISRAAQLAGCYRVEIGAWAETGQHKGFVPPTEFRLDTALHVSTLTEYYARLAQPEPARTALPEIRGRRESEPGAWHLVGNDTVRIEWYNRNIKGGYTFALRGDSAVGLATTWSHFRTLRDGMTSEDIIDPTAPARGRRVPCGG